MGMTVLFVFCVTSVTYIVKDDFERIFEMGKRSKTLLGGFIRYLKGVKKSR